MEVKKKLCDNTKTQQPVVEVEQYLKIRRGRSPNILIFRFMFRRGGRVRMVSPEAYFLPKKNLTNLHAKIGGSLYLTAYKVDAAMRGMPWVDPPKTPVIVIKKFDIGEHKKYYQFAWKRRIKDKLVTNYYNVSHKVMTCFLFGQLPALLAFKNDSGKHKYIVRNDKKNPVQNPTPHKLFKQLDLSSTSPTISRSLRREDNNINVFEDEYYD